MSQNLSTKESVDEDDEELVGIVRSLKKLSLSELNNEWVKSIWDSLFTEAEPLEEEISEKIFAQDISLALSSTIEFSIKWMERNKEGNDGSLNSSCLSGGSIWATFVERQIGYKPLLALLYYFIDKGQALGASIAERDLCVKSSSLYFILLSLPGSGAFRIFHAVLYSKVLNTFKLALKLHLVRLSPKKKRPDKSQSKKRIGIVMPDDSDDSDDDIRDIIPQSQVLELTDALNQVLFHFLFFLKNFSLKRSSESLDLTVGELVDLTNLETGFSNLNFNNRHKQSGLSLLAFNAYIGLQLLCNPLHGGAARISKLVFKALLPGVIMIPRGASEIAPKGLSVIRDHTLHFIKHLIFLLGEDSLEATEIFIQHLASHVPDKAEFRQKATLSIVSITRFLPRHVYNRVVRWFLSWSYNESSSHRLFAVEVMGALILEKERPLEIRSEDRIEINTEPPQNEAITASESTSNLISHKFIFGILLVRCRDLSAKVRAKAFKTLADITVGASEDMTAVIRSTFDENDDKGVRKKKRNSRMTDFMEFLKDSESNFHDIDPLPDAEDIIDFLKKSSKDDSVCVRRSSLQVMENIVKISLRFREDLIRILAKHCRDPSLMVRKQMIGCLTDILKRNEDNHIVIKLWVEGLLPLVLDSEIKAAERAHECLWDCLFNNLVKYSEMMTPSHFLPWRIMKVSEDLSMTKYLSRACGSWYKDGALKSTILNVIRTHVNSENNDLAWLLLAIISNHVPLKDPHFVMEYFNSSIHTPKGVGLYTLLQVLRVLFSSVSRLEKTDQKLLQKDLIALVCHFSLPPELISTATDIATVVSQLEALREDGSIDTKKYTSNVEAWTSSIIDLIDEDLQVALVENPCKNSRLRRELFTLGELAQISPQKINKKFFLLLQSLVFQGDRDNSENHNSDPQKRPFVPSPRLRALGIVTLNKMCVTNEEMAKKIVPAYGRLLGESQEPAIKNNIIYGLSDLCVKYANIVESLIPQMTTCLKDKSFLVKKTTLVTLIHLLQEDYLKLGGGRGTFFFRLLQTLTDPNDEIRSLTEFFIKQRLMKKSPNVMYQHFIEAVFYFNEYVGHSSYNNFSDPEDVRAVFSIAGENNKEKRMTLYKFMLENMNDEQRFRMTYKLCQDILGGAVEGHVKLDSNSQGLLQDTLACLASEKIKLVSLRSRNSDDNEEGADEDLAGAIAAVAKKTIISQFVKKNIIENIIPIVIALKHKLEELKNPLIDDLMNYLRELMKDYKNEVKDILSADKRLTNEIQFDLKRWEELQKRNQVSEEGNDGECDDDNNQDEVRESDNRTNNLNVNDDRLLRHVLKTAIVNFSNRRTIEENEKNLPEVSEVSRVDLSERNNPTHRRVEEKTFETEHNSNEPPLRKESEKIQYDGDGNNLGNIAETTSQNTILSDRNTNDEIVDCENDSSKSSATRAPDSKNLASNKSTSQSSAIDTFDTEAPSSEKNCSSSLASNQVDPRSHISNKISSQVPIPDLPSSQERIPDMTSSKDHTLDAHGPQNTSSQNESVVKSQRHSFLKSPSSFVVLTPHKRKKSHRAISTPSANAKNLTFQSEGDVSSITVVSPPTPKKSISQSESNESSSLSFKFGKRKKDKFDELLKKK